MYIFMCANVCVCVCACMCICVYIYMCVHRYVYVYVYICIYLHIICMTHFGAIGSPRVWPHQVNAQYVQTVQGLMAAGQAAAWPRDVL